MPRPSPRVLPPTHVSSTSTCSFGRPPMRSWSGRTMPRAQFVQDAEGGFVSCQPKLPLKLHRRHARRLAGDEVSGPEPDAERRMTALHDGADQETGLAAARTALQNTRSGDHAEGLGDQAAMRADKAVRPAGTPKIGSARRVIGKKSLKLRERLGESQIVALVDVHSRHDGQTLALVGVCVNRIGKN